MTKIISKKFLTIAAAFVIIAVTLCLALAGCSSNKDTPPAENNFSTVTDNLQSVKLAMGSAATVAADKSVTKTLTATVYPEDAKNKSVDWKLEWLDEKNSADISEYLTLNPETDGSLTANLTCHKPFTGEALITVTSREGNVFDTCRVVYVGNPSSLDIQPQGFTATSGSIGSYYELGAKNSYTFDIQADNVFGQVGAECKYTYEVSAVGSIKVQDVIYRGLSNTFEWQDGTENNINISSITTVSRYEPSVFDCTISANKLTITINCTLESYYQDSTRAGQNVKYTQRFREYTNDSWYYELKITETNSGISKSFKFRPVKVVTDVILGDEVVTF